MQQNTICRSGSETKLALSSIHLICIQQVLIAQVCSNVQMVLQNRNITFKFIHTSDLSLFVIKCDYGVCLNFRRSGKIDQFWTNIRYVLAFYFIRTFHFKIYVCISIFIYIWTAKKRHSRLPRPYILYDCPILRHLTSLSIWPSWNSKPDYSIWINSTLIFLNHIT